MSTLEDSNASLREELEKLEQEKEKLKRLLCFHDSQGEEKCPKRQRLSGDREEQEEELLDVLMEGEVFMKNDLQVV